MSILKSAVVVSILAFASAQASAKEQLHCKAQNSSASVAITFDAKSFKGRSLNCIVGNFVSDMTPCAPNGAFGLSAPTGAANLVSVVNRWQDYSDHTGGVSNNYKTDKLISFSGGFNSSSSGYEQMWKFDIDRASGSAILSQKGKTDQRFQCQKQ